MHAMLSVHPERAIQSPILNMSPGEFIPAVACAEGRPMPAGKRLVSAFLLGALCALGFCSAGAQQPINVPKDQPTIQAGINAAANGDTVLVAPGTYYENIDFMGKTITVRNTNISSGLTPRDTRTGPNTNSLPTGSTPDSPTAFAVEQAQVSGNFGMPEVEARSIHTQLHNINIVP
jgi:hypothetical protein